MNSARSGPRFCRHKELQKSALIHFNHRRTTVPTLRNAIKVATTMVVLFPPSPCPLARVGLWSLAISSATPSRRTRPPKRAAPTCRRQTLHASPRARSLSRINVANKWQTLVVVPSPNTRDAHPCWAWVGASPPGPFFLPLEANGPADGRVWLCRHENASASLILTPAMPPRRTLPRQPLSG